MQNRIAALGAMALATTVLTGCNARPPSPVANTASVTVNGKNSINHIVNCTQLEWYRTINMGSDFAGATVVIDQRAESPSVQSVRIQNLGGFTGMYSRGDGESADMSLNGEKFTITGTAHGYEAGKPGNPATATFKIVTTC